MTNERRNIPLYVLPSGARGQPTDTDLARALIAGEPWAVPATWNRFAPSVYGIAHRAFGRTTDAEDITQEVFYRLFARAHTLKEPSALRSFVVSFAIRIVKWELRRRRARRWLTLSETGDVPDEQLMVMDAESRYALRRLYNLLDRLSTRERLVLVLRHVEGMTLEEIAEAMELSLATVKRGLRRASLRVSQMVDSDDPKRRPTGTAMKRGT